MSFAKSAAQGAQARLSVRSGDLAIIQVMDAHSLHFITDNRPASLLAVQKTTEALTTYLNGGKVGLHNKYGASNIRSFWRFG